MSESKTRFIPLALFAFGALASHLPAQGVLDDRVPWPPAPLRAHGPGWSLESGAPGSARIGSGSLRRGAADANQAFVRTGWAIDPQAAPPAGAVQGFTLSWWWRPALASRFALLGGDAHWEGASPLRIFANGAAGPGQVAVRGPMGSFGTFGSPLSAGLDAQGWVHLTLRYDTAASRLAWFVNGRLDAEASATVLGRGRELFFMGHPGMAVEGPEGSFDAIRGYRFARSDSDIANDFDQPVSPFTLAPSGAPNRPDAFWLDLERLLPGAEIVTRVDGFARGAGEHPFLASSTVGWGIAPSFQGVAFGSAVINFALPANPSAGGDAPALRRGYGRPYAPRDRSFATSIFLGLQGLELAHGFSTPATPLVAAVPDGLSAFSLGAVPAAFSSRAPWSTASAPFDFVAGAWAPGTRIDVQFVLFDGVSFTTSERTRLVAASARSGPSVRIEAAGEDAFTTPGFWKVMNLGSAAIDRVTIDLTSTGLLFDPNGSLNSGGSLGAGSAVRFDSDVATGLTAITPSRPFGVGQGALSFDYSAFAAGLGVFAFDCALSAPARGSDLVGASVTVDFANGVSRSGTLLLDASLAVTASLEL